MEFRILGPLEVCAADGLVRLPGAKERALLADLLVHAGRVVSADQLVEDVWGDDPPAKPANTLQGRVSALRRSLGPQGADLVVTSPPGYRLTVAPDAVDATRFQRLVAEADAAGDRRQARGLLESALALWRGAALVEFAHQPWARAEAARLEERRLAAQEALIDLRLADGNHAELVGELEALIVTHPLRERLRGQLMLALYRSGRQADALRAYGETRATLGEELGIDPSAQLQRLQRAILTQDPTIAAPNRTDGSMAPQHNLPERLTSLVGRDRDLAEAAKLVGQHRLVTVTGPGGVGKTSVAVAAARRLVAEFPDGVWLVELAPLTDPGQLAEALATTLGVRDEPGSSGPASTSLADRLVHVLRDRILLLVLDNCEHLAVGCADLVVRLLRSTTGVRVLVTSREVLGVPGELVWPVPLLEVPDAPAGPGPAGTGTGTGTGVPVEPSPEVVAGYDAVRLFLDRARSANPGFVLDAGNAAAVAEICRRLDGLPLAVELAAAHTRALPATDLAARLADRFGLPAGPSRGVDPRHRTLRATVDWSHQLLDEHDQRLFRRLSVFAGGWTVPAADAVCGGAAAPADPGGVLAGLLRLVDRSLVVAVGGEPARFRMLETLRAYAAERLTEAGEAESTTARHTAWFLAMAEEAGAQRTRRRWIRQLDADYDNLRAAMDHATAGGDHETALRIAGALGWYWIEHHAEDGHQRLTDAVALADRQSPTIHLARALLSMVLTEMQHSADLRDRIGSVRRALELFQQFGDSIGAATAKVLVAEVQWQTSGPSVDVIALAAEAEADFAASGDTWGQAYAAMHAMALVGYQQGPSRRAEEVGRDALQHFEELDDPWAQAHALGMLAELAKSRGDVAEAVRRYEQAVAAARAEGPQWLLIAALADLGGLVAVQGDEERAVALLAESAAISRRAGWRRGIAYAWNALGAIARSRGDLERARELHREALGIVRELVGWSVPYTLAQLGCAEARLGELDQADSHLREAADLVLNAFEPATAALVLVGQALVALGRDKPERSALLLGAADAVREQAGVAPVGTARMEAEAAARTARDRLDPHAYQTANEAGRQLGAAALRP